MPLVHTADSLTVETTTDVRTDVRAFCQEYAVAYACRVLAGGRSRKAKGTAPKRVADRRTGGGDGKPADRRPITHDHCVWEEGEKVFLWQEKLNSEAFDIAQDAAVLFFAARRKAVETGDDSHRIDTLGAVRFAVRDRRKQQSRQSRPERKRCSVCRLDDGPCADCQSRLQRARERWARANRPTALAREVSESLSEVIAPVVDSIEDVMPHHAKKHVKAVIRYIASGSSQTETAEALGVNQSTVSRILSALRDTTTPADYLPTPAGSVAAVSDRTYGQGQGTSSTWVGPLADLLDRIEGHDASDYVPCHVLPAPTDKPTMPWNTWDGMSGFQWDGSGI